ncbi:two-partner secretion domain-containing protein, partial [Ralstonia syzygii]
VTLTTGTPILNGGNLDGYRVQNGTVSITGGGLDTSRVDYTDIIARSVQVNAGIWANTLKVSAGANEVSADHGQTTAIAGTGPAPSYGIDVASLGGMYAGKITLVGTESGVGVRNAGQIGASAGDVTVTADGRLENSGRITASAGVRADTNGGLANSGTLYAQGDTQLSTRGNVDNTGTIAAQGNTAIAATGASSSVTSHAGS